MVTSKPFLSARDKIILLFIWFRSYQAGNSLYFIISNNCALNLICLWASCDRFLSFTKLSCETESLEIKFVMLFESNCFISFLIINTNNFQGYTAPNLVPEITPKFSGHLSEFCCKFKHVFYYFWPHSTVWRFTLPCYKLKPQIETLREKNHCTNS